MAKNVLNKLHELRTALIRASERLNLPFIMICHHLGINYREFLGFYANVKNLKDDGNSRFSDDSLRAICEILGVDIRYVIVVKESEDQLLEERRKFIKDQYVNREKRSITQEEKPAAKAKQSNNKVSAAKRRRGKVGAARLRPGIKKGKGSADRN